MLFLDEEPGERTMRRFYRDGQASYFPLFREGQYDRLEKKVLVESGQVRLVPPPVQAEELPCPTLPKN